MAIEDVVKPFLFHCTCANCTLEFRKCAELIMEPLLLLVLGGSRWSAVLLIHIQHDGFLCTDRFDFNYSIFELNIWILNRIADLLFFFKSMFNYLFEARGFVVNFPQSDWCQSLNSVTNLKFVTGSFECRWLIGYRQPTPEFLRHRIHSIGRFCWSRPTQWSAFRRV